MNGTLSLLDELETTLASGSSSRGIAILTSVTDLFINGAPRFSEDQIGVFDDVMARLMVKIEAKARAKLAQRLAPIANAPCNVIQLLASDDDIEVARPVLTRSERLSEHTLVATANSKSQQHLYAITQRDALSEAVTDILVERGDRDVVHAVAKNRGARFSDAGFRALVTRSNGDDALASEVGMRGDIPRPHFLMLLEKASSAVRARLAAENPQATTTSTASWPKWSAASAKNSATPRRPSPRPRRRWRGRTASAASAKPRFTSMRASASSRKPRSRCRSCATRRSTWSSGRCSIRAPRSC